LTLQPVKPAVVSLFSRQPDPDEEEVRITVPASPAGGTARARTVLPDLTGSPLWFLIGAGQTGKTTFARWAAPRAFAHGRTPVQAAFDPSNRTLVDFFDNVHQPPSGDPASALGFLRDVIQFLMKTPTTALLDMGGGDTSLLRLAQDVPGIGKTMAADGVAPVAAYFFGPRVDDLAVLAAMQAAAFRPAATVLILNFGRVSDGEDASRVFAPLRAHSIFRAAVDAGAVVIDMPRLEPRVARDVERRRLQFADARDGLVPEGKKVTPIGGLDRSYVRRWLDQMDAAFAPVAAWLP